MSTRLHLVEVVLEQLAGARTRWRVSLRDRKGREVWSTIGRGPLGRLRARRRALEQAEREGLELEGAELVAPDVPPFPRSPMLAVSRCLNRLRFEGVI